MLVLSRAKGEKIVIGEAVEITVIQPGRSRVKIGIKAPIEVSIVRPDCLVDSESCQGKGRKAANGCKKKDD